MGTGVYKAYSFTMGATSSSASVNLQRGFAKVYLQIPSMASFTGFDVYASADGSQTYYPLRKDIPNTTTAQCWTFTIAASACGTNNGSLVPIPGGFQFYKIISTDSVPTASLGFEVLCGDN